MANTVPALASSTTSLSFGNQCINTTANQSFSFTGSNLSGAATLNIAAVTGYSYSLTQTGTYTSTLTISNYTGNDTTVWIQFLPTAVQTYSGTITISGQGANSTASLSITTSGAGINTAGTVTATAATSITGASAVLGATSVQGCSSYTTYGIEYSNTTGFVNGSGTILTASNFNGTSFSVTSSSFQPSTTYYYKAFITDATGTIYSSQLSFTTSGLDTPVATTASNITQTSFTANWNAVPGATAYKVEVSTSPTFGATNATITATDLFFSEYVEGTSNNKYVEIYNGTGASVNLSNYKLRMYANGGTTASYDITLSGTLANGATAVYKNSSATLYSGTSTTTSAAVFNGNDAIALYKVSTASNVDIIGRIGEDPGTEWRAFGGYSTLDKTLRRKNTVTHGVTTNPTSGFPTIDTEWDVYDINDVSGLGSHDFGFVSSYVSGYENSSASTNSLDVTGLTENTTYYYRVKAQSTNDTSDRSNTQSVTTKIGNIAWTIPSGQTTATWVPATDPNTDINVTIDADYSTATNGGFTAKNVTVNAGKKLTVAANTTLTVYGVITNNSNAENVVVQNNGALIQYNDTANTGNITVQRNSANLYRLDYTIWSTPVTGTQTLQQFSPATSSNRFYEYKYDLSSSTNTMVEAYFGVAATSTFDLAKGYLIRMPNADSATGYNGGTAAITFTGNFVGVPNTGTITRTMNTGGSRYTGTGNPYPSPISVADFFATNSSVLDASSGIYLWRKKNDATSSSYAVLTLVGLAANNSSSWGGQDQETYFSGSNTNWTLAPGQGFLVRTNASASNPSLTFTNSMRRATPVAGQAFLRNLGTTISRYAISLTDATAANSQALVAYVSEASTGVDFGYDGKRFSDDKLSLYTLEASNEFAVQARPSFENQDVVNLGYVATTAGTHTISLNTTEGVFNSGQEIYLIDNATGIVRPLSQGSYTFTTDAGTFNNRFQIRYSTAALGTITPDFNANMVVVYTNNKVINVDAGTAIINTIAVYDINGRKLYSTNGVHNTSTQVSLPAAAQQVLIIEIGTDKGTVSKKIVY